MANVEPEIAGVVFHGEVAVAEFETGPVAELATEGAVEIPHQV